MADLDARLVPKASGTSGQEPLASDLLVGEIAINTADGLSYVKHTDNTIKILGRNYLSELLDVSDSTPVDGNSLKWNESTGEWEPGSVTVEGISNILVNDPLPGQVLEWTGSDWRNSYADISNSKIRELSDVQTATPPNLTGLRYNQAAGEFQYVPYFENPLTTQGDILIYFGGNSVRLGIGGPGQVLSVSGGIPAWTDPAVGGSIDQLSDVDITTRPPVDGDVLIWNSTNSQFEPGSNSQDVLATEWEVSAQGNAAYLFDGPGFTGTEENPTLYVMRGQVYRIVNNMGLHPFRLQSTPGLAGTVYSNGVTNNGVSNGVLEWEVRMDAPSTLYYQCTAHEVMQGTIKVLDGTGDGGGGATGVTSIIAGSGIEVDQSTGDVTISATGGSGGGIEEAPADGTPYARQDETWVPVPTGGGGGGSGAGIYLTETQTASGGAADFVGLGYSGILQKVVSTLDAWIVLYSNAAERTADASRSYGTDPTPGSGVLFEAYVTAGGTVTATPGTTYMNNDATLTEAVYAAVRDQDGNSVDAAVTFTAYGLAAITAVSGGTFGSG